MSKAAEKVLAKKVVARKAAAKKPINSLAAKFCMDIRWTTVEANGEHLDGGSMFGNAPKLLWNRWVESDDLNRIPMATRCLLVRADDRNVLIDAGISPFMKPELAERYGVPGDSNLLISNLEKKGVSEQDIDCVILSHLHFDHAGSLPPLWPGIQSGGWQPAFPNAKYYLNARQYERALNPHPRDKASYIKGLPEKLQETGRLVLLEDGDSIPECDAFMSLFVSDGHTPGLLMPLVDTGSEKVFFPSDLISGEAWVHLPITCGFDRNAELVVDEKEPLLKRAVDEDWTVVYIHDPKTPCSKIRYNSKKQRYESFKA